MIYRKSKYYLPAIKKALDEKYPRNTIQIFDIGYVLNAFQVAVRDALYNGYHLKLMPFSIILWTAQTRVFKRLGMSGKGINYRLEHPEEERRGNR